MGLCVASGSGVVAAGTSVIVVTGMGAVVRSGRRGVSVPLPAMEMSAHARNSSWGPQPTAPVPLEQLPQLLPRERRKI